jgi:hypothetical protein
MRTAARPCLRVAATLAMALTLPLATTARATPTQVSVFPSPGTKYNQPQTQIALRAHITVTDGPTIARADIALTAFG